MLLVSVAAIKKHCRAKGVTKCNILTDGGNQKVLCINEGNLYRLAANSKTQEAEKFEEWVFDEVIPSIRKTGSYNKVNKSTRVAKLEAAGKSPEFIEKRIETVATRKTFTSVLKEHGVKGLGYQMCTRSTYAPLFGGDGSTAFIKEKFGINPKESVRDSIPMVQLVAVQLSELLAAEMIESKKANGNVECATACLSSARHVAQAVTSTKKQLSAA